MDTTILDVELFRISGTPITLATLFSAVLVLLTAYFISRLIQRALDHAVSRRTEFRKGTLAVTRRLLHYAIMLIAIGVALDTMGINLATLFAAGAVFAVGLGFAMQNIAQNFVSGVILLAERTIKPGDVLEIDNRVVRVREMGIRSTLVRTRDDEDVIVPNAVLVQSSVKNFTLRDSVYRIRTAVGVSYSSDLDLVQRVLTEVAASQPWRHASHEPRTLLLGFGSSSVDFEVSVWVDDPWTARVAQSELNHAIWTALKQANVVIAFPQMDVHLDAPVVQALGGRV